MSSRRHVSWMQRRNLTVSFVYDLYRTVGDQDSRKLDAKSDKEKNPSKLPFLLMEHLFPSFLNEVVSKYIQQGNCRIKEQQFLCKQNCFCLNLQFSEHVSRFLYKNTTVIDMYASRCEVGAYQTRKKISSMYLNLLVKIVIVHISIL